MTEPLWEVMRDAYVESSGTVIDRLGQEVLPGPEREEFMAMILAVRDYMVPEEPPPHRGMRPGGTNLTHQEKLSVERQRLRALFTAEAERAAGSASPVGEQADAIERIEADGLSLGE